jgi:exosortase/archaeosortase family protein
LHFAFHTSGANEFPLSAFRFSDFVFPVCFFLVAVPWPSGVENFLVQTLTRLNVSATVEVLGWFGIPALQHGNVIEVATGDVGIDEACSGIRSFQAMLMISLFFGELYALSATRRALLVIAGFALSFLFNMTRTTLLTWVAAKRGVAAIAAWHDPAGVTILVACFLTLWLAAVWLGKKQGARSREQGMEGGKRPGEIGEDISRAKEGGGRPGEVTNQTSRAKEGAGQRTTGIPTPSTFNFQLSTLQKLAIALLAWFVLVEAGTQLWYRLHENSAVSREEWSVNVDGTNSRLTKVEIPASIRAQFRADENVEAQWRDDDGNIWRLYYFRWFPAHSLNKRVAVQLAKTHGPEICLTAIGMTMKSDFGIVTVPVGDLKLAFRQYVFLADERPLHVFYAIYEDPTGSAILANRRQDTASRIAAAFAGSRNNGQRFLEMAVAGPENPEEARTALRGELNKLIVSKP